MNIQLRRLLVALTVSVLPGSLFAQHDVYIKIDKDVQIDKTLGGTEKFTGGFELKAKLKQSDTSIKVTFEKNGNSPILIGNLSTIDINSVSFQTTAWTKALIYKDIRSELGKKLKEMTQPQNANKDLEITIKHVGGLVKGTWKADYTWIPTTTTPKYPIKLINATDWNLEIMYNEEPQGGIRYITEYLSKQDQTKVNYLEFGDFLSATGMVLKGKYAAPGTWKGWATAGTLDSKQADISRQIRDIWQSIDVNKNETIAIIIKHVARVSGVGNWDVEVAIVKQSDKIEDLAKQYSVTPTQGAPAMPGKGSGKLRAPRLTALTTQEQVVVVRNNTNQAVKVDVTRGKVADAQQSAASLTNLLVTKAEEITALTLTVDGFSTYDAMPMLKEAKKHFDTTRGQHIVFDVRHVGKTPESWVVKVKMLSYTTTNNNKIIIEPKSLTYKHGGKVKRQ